jgi:hypothetical protein
MINLNSKLNLDFNFDNIIIKTLNMEFNFLWISRDIEILYCNIQHLVC